MRIDKAFSWEYPLAVHGLMHNVITNAWRGDPYPIDTLLIFMANMAWNSTMNTVEIRRLLNDRHADGPKRGEHKIPFIVVCDAFQSEMTAFADLVPSRYDVSRAPRRDVDARPADIGFRRADRLGARARRASMGECKPFQEVLIELASRLKFPAFVRPDGTRKFRDYPDFIVNYETDPGSGIGFLSGWRGKDGDKFMRGEPNPRNGRCTRRTTASTSTSCRHRTNTCATGTAATWNGRSECGSAATPTRARADLFGSAAELSPRGER
jgi:anaerobic selenocysteine-containing dehydrogenase